MNISDLLISSTSQATAKKKHLDQSESQPAKKSARFSPKVRSKPSPAPVGSIAERVFDAIRDGKSCQVEALTKALRYPQRVLESLCRSVFQQVTNCENSEPINWPEIAQALSCDLDECEDMWSMLCEEAPRSQNSEGNTTTASHDSGNHYSEASQLRAEVSSNPERFDYAIRKWQSDRSDKPAPLPISDTSEEQGYGQVFSREHAMPFPDVLDLETPKTPSLRDQLGVRHKNTLLSYVPVRKPQPGLKRPLLSTDPPSKFSRILPTGTEIGPEELAQPTGIRMFNALVWVDGSGRFHKPDWLPSEDAALILAIRVHGSNWDQVKTHLRNNQTAMEVQLKWELLVYRARDALKLVSGALPDQNALTGPQISPLNILLRRAHMQTLGSSVQQQFLR
eukprot:c5945_g1_i2.p1 GENE.c5945_g1_i2~~c5945_g1_i2.p1  ORF type:complete len:394 (+),score=42.48 c5945_g1_i2:56-1237(+)